MSLHNPGQTGFNGRPFQWGGRWRQSVFILRNSHMQCSRGKASKISSLSQSWCIPLPNPE